MKRTLIFFSMLCFVLSGAEIILPKPDLQSGKPLMECFSQRRSGRNFDSRPLSKQIIGEILFAADGINRPDGHKTVPTALNKQNQTVYAVTADGIYLYNYFDINHERYDILGSPETCGPVDPNYVSQRMKYGFSWLGKETVQFVTIK